jgi:sterol 3beta-glucosyltransferase
VGPPPPELDEASVPHTKAGFIFLDDGAGLDPELDAFLTEGEPPVYLGFGSMKTRHPERLARLLADAASGAGRRALIAGGWAGLAAKDLPPGCRIISSAPHHALFPRVAAVVHHGGAGTTGAAARAGVPQVVVPHFGDQFYWGFRVEALGVGPAPLSRLRLSAKKLSAAIRAALSAECVARARALGERVRARDGLAEAVRVVEAAARG